MSFQIEPAGWEAAPEVIELIHRVFDEYGFIWDPEDEFWDLLAEEQAFPYRAPIGGMWVMRDDEGAVVGSIAAERVDGPTVELHRLYLDARLRGRGWVDGCLRPVSNGLASMGRGELSCGRIRDSRMRIGCMSSSVTSRRTLGSWTTSTTPWSSSTSGTSHSGSGG